MNRELWVIDSETDPFVFGKTPKPFVWGAKSKNQYVQFDKTEDMVNFFRDKYALVYAHNGGKFDFHFFMHLIGAYEKIVIINGRLTKFKIDGAEYRDSYSIMPIPLSAYKKDEIDYKIFTADKRKIPENKKKIEDYLKTDCEYLYDLVEEFIGFNGTKLTIASAAMSEWQKMSDENISQSQNDYNYIEKYYFGGRVECFKKGVFDENLVMIDIVSAYPDAMRNNSHPYGNVTEITKDLPDTQGEVERSFITLTCISNGAFPVRAKSGSLSFPSSSAVAEFNVTGWEYLAAIRLKLISDVTIIRVVEFETKINFKKYVDKWFAIKKSSVKKSPPYQIAKLMLNSLYGKFAQDSRDHKQLTLVPTSLVETAENNGMTLEGLISTNPDMAIMKEGEGSDKFYNLGTAASITGCVRAKLMTALATVKDRYYCDTDSIICKSIGSLPLSDNIGGWEVDTEIKKLAIAGKKMYALRSPGGETKIASKGVRLTFDEVVRVAQGETVEYKNPAPSFSITGGATFTPRNVKRT